MGYEVKFWSPAFEHKMYAQPNQFDDQVTSQQGEERKFKM